MSRVKSRSKNQDVLRIHTRSNYKYLRLSDLNKDWINRFCNKLKRENIVAKS